MKKIIFNSGKIKKLSILGILFIFCIFGWTAFGQSLARSFNSSGDSLQSASALSTGSTNTLSVVFDMYKPSYTNSDSWLIASRRFYVPNDGTFLINPDCSSPSGQFCVSVTENFGTLTCYFARPSAAAWHHYAIDIFSGGSTGTCTVYVDGTSVAVSYASQTGNITNFSADQIDIGQRIDFGPAFNFVGYLSRIAIFTGSLSGADASTISGCGSPTSATSATLINYWPINQTSPEVATTGGIDLNVSGTINIAGPCMGTPTLSASPTSVLVSTTGNTITLTGTSTAWTPGTPGSPTFTVTNSGGTSCAITAQTVSSTTSATITLNAGSTGGTCQINDPANSTSANITIIAPQTWFIRTDGGTRYSTNVTSGQCNGLTDAAYPGTGTNRNCAYNDFRYLWDDGSIGNFSWVISGGDTIVVRGCHASADQSNPDDPHCRLGFDNNIGNSSTNPWCWFAPAGYGSNQECRNPIIPAGTSGAHTKILGGCAYDGTSCAGSNKAQLFAGFGALWALDLASTQYVDIIGIELTTHNSSHCNKLGTPAFTHGCNGSTPGADDYGSNGIRTINTTSNINLTDVNIHGFAQSGMTGPIGGAINMTRVNVSYSVHSAWNMDDGAQANYGTISAYSISSNILTLTVNQSLPVGSRIQLQGFSTSTFLNGSMVDIITSAPTTMTASFTHANASATESGTYDKRPTPNAPGSSIIGSYVNMIGNGCIEEYPITDPLPMLSCYDSDSGGFGDAWSGQDSDLDTFTCDHCVAMYNTKDGDIGPHTLMRVYSKTNSISAFNMGQQWKWGSNGTIPQTTTFYNNLTVSGCSRMSASITGAPATFNAHLGLFCRAAGSVLSPNISPGSTWNIYNNTFVFNALTLLDIHCFVGAISGCPSTINWKNNAVIGYGNIPTVVYGPAVPAIYFFNDFNGTLNLLYSSEYGTRNGGCDSFVTATNMICTDPLFLNEPSQASTAQSALDVFTNTVNTSSFYPTAISPLIHAGTTGGPSTDYFGITQTSPATIGAMVFTHLSNIKVTTRIKITGRIKY